MKVPSRPDLTPSKPPQRRDPDLFKGIIALILLVGICILVWKTLGHTNAGNDSSTGFSASVVDSTVSSGGHWAVAIHIENTGSAAKAPECIIYAMDADNFTLASDSTSYGELSPGESVTATLTTSLRPGENTVDHWDVNCS